MPKKSKAPVATLVAKPPKPEEDQYRIVDVIPSACPKCQCTDREPYFAIKAIDSKGISPAGYPYTRLTFKRTRCKRCKQARVDRLYENTGEV